jgi:hypothetical protein
MSASKLSESGLNRSGLKTTPCRVVMFYENGLAHQKAEETCHQLSTQLGVHAPIFEFDHWRFHCLATPVLAQLAEEAAAEADIVLFALCSEEFPPEVIEWLETWTHRRTSTNGLMALVTTWPEDFMPLTDTAKVQLEAVARRLGMDFLSRDRLPEMGAATKVSAATQPVHSMA